MSTTIDSLQIEIQSSSSNAAGGIQRLANALGRLKKVGSFKVVTKNLEDLSKAIKDLSAVSSAGSNLQSVAKAVESLKAAGSFGSFANSFSKLGTALKDLEGMNIDGVVAKIKELNDKVGPVSQKLVSIGNAFKVVNKESNNTSRGFSAFSGKVNTTTMNLSHFINVAKSVIASLKRIINMFEETIGDAIEWEGISQRFGRGFGTDAQDTYDWILELNKEMGINTQQFMQYSSTYATMLKGFGVASEDASKMALGYMELTYDVWSGYNDIYTSLDDAATAIRSAIAGEVEPVRKAGFTIIESTLEQTAANHGLKISLEKATEAQKSYLRYLTLVDQAKAQDLIGNYAREMNTAEGMMRTFNQQLKSLGQTFGSIFLPILVKVMPYVQAFIDLLGDAIIMAANLFGVEIQKVDFGGSISSSADGATESVNGTTEALKELKNATTGIDELNIISPQSGGSGASVSGGFNSVDVDSLWDKSIFDQIQSNVDEIKEKMKEWLGITGEIDSWADLFDTKLGKILTTVGLVGGAFALWKIGTGTVTAIKIISGAVAAIKGAGIISWITEFVAAAKLMAPEVGWMAALFPKLSGWFASIGTAISGAATSVGTFLAGISAPAWGVIAAVIAAVASAIAFMVVKWDELKNATNKFFKEEIAPKFERIKKAATELWDALKYLLQPIFDLCEGFAEWWEAAKPLETLGDMIVGLGGIVVSVLGSVVMGVINGLASAITGIVEVVSGVVGVITGIIELFVNAVCGIFTGDWSGIEGAWKRICDSTKTLLTGLYDATIGIIVELVDGVIEWFTNLWDELVGHSIVPDIVNDIVAWFGSLPGKVFEAIGSFFSDLIGKFNGFWSDLTSWWNSKTALSTYTPSIGSIKDNLSSAWNSAKTWWDKTKVNLRTYTPSFGSIKDALSGAWDSAKTWWDKTKVNLRTYTPSFGSIKDALSSAWNGAKTWWNNNAKLSVPSLSLKVTYSKVTGLRSAIVNALGLEGWPSLKFAANGGIFDMGSLVWAGERGPEIVANAGGGKTGVMNVQQMSEAVYEGVYSAVVAAMRASGGNSGSQSVNVYLDGKQITSSVEQRQKERGAALMGNQVYAY